MEILISDVIYNLIYNYDPIDSYLEVIKNDTDMIYCKDNILYQKFKLEIEAINGDISNIEINNLLDNGLSDISNITIKESPISSIATDTIYDDFNLLNIALQNKKLSINEKFILEYVVKVDKDIYSENPIKSYNDTITIKYKDNKNDFQEIYDIKSANYIGPNIDKIANWGDSKKTSVKWTINIELNSLNDINKTSLNDYNIEIIDIPNGDWYKENVPSITPDIFSYTNNLYTYSYTQNITDEYLNKLTAINLYNTIEMNLNIENLEIEKSDIAFITLLPRKQWIFSDAINYDYGEKEIFWKISMNSILDGINDVKIKITTPKWSSNEGNHKLNKKIYIKTDNSEEQIIIIDEDGNFLENNGIISNYKYNLTSSYIELTFDNSYISSMAKENIYIYITSTITDNNKDLANLKYRNRIDFNFTFNNDLYTGDAAGMWKKPYNLSRLSGKMSIGNEILNQISFYPPENQNDITDDTKILITDYIPDDMEFLNKDMEAYIYDGAIKSVKDEFSAEESDNKMNFYMPATNKNVTSAMFKYYLRLKDYKTFALNGETKEYNFYTQYSMNGKILGDYYSTLSLTPQKIVEENATYSLDTAPYINYEIIINPDLIDLSDDDTLIAKNIIGDALSYDLKSIKIEKYDNGTWRELTKNNDYLYSLNTNNNLLTFKIPDETYLKITYKAKVNLYVSTNESKNGILTKDNSYNTIFLDKYDQETTKDTKSFSCTAITPRIWADSKYANINILNYWNNNEQMEALNGCKFKLEKCHWDSNNNEMITDEIVNSNITIENDGTYELTNLLYDRIYKLTEIEAASGFDINTEPKYFIIVGAANITLPENINIQKISNDSTLAIENTTTTFFIKIPKKLEFSSNKTIEYDINVMSKSSNIRSITVEPNDEDKNVEGINFLMYETLNKKDNVMATVLQDNIKWTPDEFMLENGTSKKGVISAYNLSAGNWSGTLNFNISIETN